VKLSFLKSLGWGLVILPFIPFMFLAAILPSPRRKLLLWGVEPGIGTKYWSEAVKEIGYDSMTLMNGFYGINKREDFDRYYEDFARLPLPIRLRWSIGSCLAMIFALRRAAVVHTSFWGFSLGLSPFWRLESLLFRLSRTKVVILAFGADYYRYSTLADSSLRYGMLASYPRLARQEESTTAKVMYWVRNADIVITGYQIDGVGRWDVTTHSAYMIDTRKWVPKAVYSNSDGRNGTVRIMHAPNHRGVKGTEFIVEAVEQLKREGLKAELVLLEKVPNDRVRELMQEVDILADQCIMIGYALNSMEGMASGLPVLANLSSEFYTRPFRRYGSLDECPIVSTTPENVLANLRILVSRPELREELGRAGRLYAEKYHSYEMAQYLFGSIYDRILHGKDVDLLNLFHPLKSDYRRRRPIVEHPLHNSRLAD
jgi:glycosyltransferase involved in cell wall biosynthesis